MKADALYLRKVELMVVGKGGLKVFKDLRITFSIEKTNEGTPNTSTISIYNLNDQSRAMLEDKNARVILSAGYTGNFGVIFSGNIVKAKQAKKKQLQKTPVGHRLEGVDIITEIEAADGNNKYRNARLHKGFPPGTPLRDVFTTIGQAVGLPANIDLESIPENAQYANGFSVDGLCKDMLGDLCRNNGLEWSIQNEVLQIIAKDKTTKFGAVVLTPETGLIGSPEKMIGGVKFNSLLQPALAPGCSVEIKSKFVTGKYKVRTVTHAGDSHEGDFLSQCEATI